MKYTREMLAEAAKNSTTIADVLRYLGIPLTGGAHTHIKRRLVELDIDHSHFTGRGHRRGRASPRRLTAAEVLVIREPHRRRPVGSMLARALVETGVPLRCQSCGVGPLWNDVPLVLQVDHINGNYADCRAENLRFLCPNCHSQTRTYAGRGKRSSRSAPNRPRRRQPVANTPLTVEQAAALLGCSTSYFYKLRARLVDGVPTRTESGVRGRERPETQRLAVIECALRHPEEGPRKIAERLRVETTGEINISHGTVTNVLLAAGLNTAEARRAVRQSD